MAYVNKKIMSILGIVMASLVSSAFAHDHQENLTLTEETAEAPFLAENNAAMEKMMADMGSAPTGNIDRDFVTSMSAHHQGAIDMAVTMLKYGHNEQLKRMAQEIIVEQMQEIAAMRQAVGDPLPASVASPTQIFASQP